MGFLSPSVSFSRYRVTDPLPDNFWNWAFDRVNSRAFREREEGIEELTCGWVSFRNPFQQGLSLVDISYGDYLVASLRVDVRRVPPAVLRKHCILEEERMKAEQEMARLSRKMKNEMRDRVRFRLLAKVLPVPKTYDLCWNIGEGVLLFFACQESAQAILEDLFHQTFGFRLTLGLSLLPAQGEKEALEGLTREAWV
jgi:hypothetical protein